jgi:DNA primase large subunit
MAVDDLRKNQMMANLLDALEAGKDVGHYGRLVFAMVSRHFLSEDEVVGYLEKDKDFGAEEARALYQQVQGRDYSPPKREKILEWQQEQDFAIIPNPDDPDAGNVYRDLQFPDQVYEHISGYYEQKAEAEDKSEAGAR